MDGCKDTCLKVGWWKISMDRFFWVENSFFWQVEMFTARCSRATGPGSPLTTNRKVRVVGRCCASWGVIYVTGASIFFRRYPGFCAPSSCAELDTSRHRFPGTSGFVFAHGRHEEKHCFEETRTEAGRVFNSSLKRGACYSFNSSQAPNQGKKLGKESVSPPCCCSCSVSLGRNSLDLTRIWKVCSPVTSMYDEVFLGPVSPLFWSLSYWSCPGSRNYHWYSKTIWPGQMCDVWHCFFMYDCSWPTSLEPFPIKTSVTWVPGT